MRGIRAVDCHAHVIAPDRFPYADGAGYRPRPDETGPFEAFSEVLARHGVGRALVVQPSCYGLDNACLLDALARSHGRFRGIAVVAPETAEEELAELQGRGVVGVRLNLVRSDPAALSRPDAGRFLARVTALGWFVQVYASGDMWVEIGPVLRDSGATVLVDHMGEPDPSRGVDQPGFQAVLGLGRDTGAVVKLSAPYRVSRRPHPHEDVAPFVAALLDAFSVNRCVWGSDWPFLGVSQPVDYASLLACLERWLPHAGDRERVLWENPVRLFGFTENACR